MAPKGKDDVEEKLTGIIRKTIAEVLGERDDKERTEKETPEQRWLRKVIKEEVGSMFEAFAAGYEESKERDERPDDGEQAGGGFLTALVGGKR